MPESMLADYYVALADMKNVLTMSERFRQVGTRTVQVSRTCNQIRFDYCLPILTVWTRLSFRLNKWNLCVGCTTVDKLLFVWLVFYLCCAVSKLTLTWRVTNNEILPPLGLQSSPAFSFCGPIKRWVIATRLKMKKLRLDVHFVDTKSSSPSLFFYSFLANGSQKMKWETNHLLFQRRKEKKIIMKQEFIIFFR